MSRNFTEKQIHILNVAEELIAKKGFEGTSVRDISTKAGINVAMISYYFGSKEKMMSYLYRYRVQRTRENFAEFSETIRDGRPEMQMKEFTKYIINLLFTYNYFHGFVTQELREIGLVQDDLLEFYKIVTDKFDQVVKKGVMTGVFTNAPKAEDLLTILLGSAIFVIRNKNFYQLYLGGREEDYLKEAEEKVMQNLLVTVFSLLGYSPE